MARGKKPAISQSDRRKWLEGLENGKGITQVAKKAKRDIRIVKRHIEIAREERQAALVSHDFLLKILEQHQEDLLAEVVRLQQLLARNVPTGLTPDESVRSKIFDALNEHIKRSPVKKQLDQWEDIFAKYSGFKEAVSSELRNEESGLISAIPGEPVLYPWTLVIVEVMESGHSFEESGRNYRREPLDNGKYKVSWGDRILTRSGVTNDQAARVIEAHKKLVTFAEKYLPEFQEYSQQFKQLSGQLVDELDVFNIKRVVPGRCQYCPV